MGDPARPASPAKLTASAWTLAVPGALDTATGGYRYDRHMVHGLAVLGRPARVLSLSPRFPAPDAHALAQADAALRAEPDGQVVVIDGLALGAMSEVAHAHAHRLRLIGLVHHPLALETSTDDANSQAMPTAAKVQADEQDALAHVRGVIVTSPATGRELQAHYGVPAERLRVVVPGTQAAPLAHGSAPGQPLRLLCVATLTRRKGHDLLFDALDQLAKNGAAGQPGWHVDLVGSLDRAPDWTHQLRQRWLAAPWREQVTWHGEVSDEQLAMRYRQADAFVLASRHEGYGMVLAEALSHGLPVISTQAGAIPDTVPADAGCLVPPNNAVALAQALAHWLADPKARRAWQAGARRARQALPDWPATCAQFAQAMDDLSALPVPAGAEPGAQSKLSGTAQGRQP